jgi:hypothetical protein
VEVHPIENQFKMSGYQSTGYQDIGVNQTVHVNEDHVEHKPVQNEDKAPFLQGVPSPSSHLHDEDIPHQSLSVGDCFNPKLDKFIGIGLMKWVWWIGLFTILIYTL